MTAMAATATRLTARAGVRRERHEAAYPLLIAVIALLAIGVVMVYSASSVRSYISTTDPASQGFQQGIWAALGLVLMLAASRTDFRLLRYAAIPVFWVTLALLVIVLIPGIGTSAFGSRRWLYLPGIGGFQPAELAKLAVCLYLAHWLDRRGTEARGLWNGLVPFVILVAPGFLLIAFEPDLGTAGVYAAASLAIFFMAGANLLYLGAVGAAVVGAAYLMVTQTAYLPAPSTDFIFAIIGEEWGLIGTLTVLALFVMVAYQGYRIAITAPDTFSGLLAAGITTWLVAQACINMMVVTALLPVTGIPLPFISYGGSALIINLVAVGILLSISRETTQTGSMLDAVFGVGRRDRRAHLPRAGRRKGTARRAARA